MKTITTPTDQSDFIFIPSPETIAAFNSAAAYANCTLDQILDSQVIECLGPLTICMPHLMAAANDMGMKPANVLRCILANALEYARHDPAAIAKFSLRKHKHDAKRGRPTPQ